MMRIRVARGGRRPRPSFLACFCLAVALPLAVACGGGGGGGGGGVVTPIVAGFSGSGTASSPDLVRLTGSVAGDQVVLTAVIRGQTTNSDIYSFAFDLVLGDATVAQYVNGSVAFGSALTLTGNQTGQALASQNGNRIVVGVSKIGGGLGNGIGPTEEVVVTLNFRVLRRASTTLTFGGPPQALDSQGNVIGTIQFDAAAASISGT